MSRPSFRPRPIDLNKALPIVKTNRDLKHDEDSVTVARALPAMATGVDPNEEEERHLQQALLVSIYGEDRSKALSEIPIPVVKERNFDTSQLPKFEPPAKYINFNRNDDELDSITVEYELDKVDETFLQDLKTKKQIDISPDDFEAAMDKLEKMQGRPVELLPYSVMRRVLVENLPSSVPEAGRKELYSHWMNRRSVERKGRPFLRFLQQPPDVNDPNPAVAFRHRDDFPAGSGRARQARQNTYENYKRLVKLRSDFDRLRIIAEKSLRREKLKKGRSFLKVESSRLMALQQLLPESVKEHARAREISANDKQAGSLTPGARKHPRGYDAAAKDAQSKKKKKILVGKGGAASDQAVSAKVSQPGLDQFSFDEKGKEFLRKVRYFHGSFVNYGVSPYDHRVFSAAAESYVGKGTTREAKPVDLSEIKFAKFENGASQRVLPRFSRLGRVMLDPMPAQAEKTPKVVTYAASSSLGGAYTAGIPYEKMDDITRLGSHDRVTQTFRSLMPELSGGANNGSNANDADSSRSLLDFWPSRSKKSSDKKHTQEQPVDTSAAKASDEELPFFAPRKRQLVFELD
mmetsp:Transcript_12366/g.37715  ORF Transcript_12366/g.37715 Transcript_12366/m.37715 type:complete len:576 (+) Transcript_12366:152-1879(+)